MNTQLNVPEQISFGKKGYSKWMDWQVNAWLYVAVVFASATDFFFAQQIRQWHLGLRVIIALIPMVAAVMWVRSLARWIRGMDELHRRIMVASVLFTVSAMLFVVTVWNRLDQAGLFWDLLPRNPAFPYGNWNIVTPSHLFLLMTLFYVIGHRIFNRRYQ